MLIVALSGGIATGKSQVARVFEELGCYIHKADLEAHELMAPEKPAWEKIVDRFGSNILNPDNTINRARLASIIFSDKKERLFLNNLLHPLVLKERQEAILKLRNRGLFKIFVSEAALTIEAGYTKFYDKIVITHCPKNIQIERLMSRDSVDRTKALERIESQMPPEQKLKYADYTIDTSGTLEKTIEQSEQVFRILMSDYENLYGRKTQSRP